MIVFCPWCNAERSVFAVGRAGGIVEIEWSPCTTPRCRGTMITLVTDPEGFVIHPNHIRGQFVARRKIKDGKKKQYRKD